MLSILKLGGRASQKTKNPPGFPGGPTTPGSAIAAVELEFKFCGQVERSWLHNSIDGMLAI